MTTIPHACGHAERVRWLDAADAAEVARETARAATRDCTDCVRRRVEGRAAWRWMMGRAT